MENFVRTQQLYSWQDSSSRDRISPRNSGEGCGVSLGLEQAFTVSAARGALLTHQGNFQPQLPSSVSWRRCQWGKKSQGIVDIIKATELYILKWRILCWMNYLNFKKIQILAEAEAKEAEEEEKSHRVALRGKEKGKTIPRFPEPTPGRGFSFWKRNSN